LAIGLFIPMNWGAPQGPVLVVRNSVAIVPDVAGEVVDVPVRRQLPAQGGDPAPYQSQVDTLEAQYKLAERFNSELAGRPRLGGDAKKITYYPGQVGLPPEASPRVLNKSWTMTADVEIPDGGAEGMIVTHGGIVGGYGLYVRQGKLTFVYNYLALERTTITATQPLPKGKAQIKVDFAYQGGPKELGKAAVVTLTANGTKVAAGQVPKTIPATISIQEGLDIGMDVGSPVDFTYTPPFKFTGTIDKVTIDLK
jgi:hypothetical protein